MSRAACPRRTLTRFSGGCTFAEDPARSAPEAHIIWHADLDPGTLQVMAEPARPGDPDAIDLDRLAAWLTVAPDQHGHEHAAISNGWQRIRLDVEAGTLRAGGPVLFIYRLVGMASAAPRILPLRRLLALARHGRFATSLFPADPRIARWLDILRVADALADGASQREIAAALFGQERAVNEWSHEASLRSRVRRLVREAREMARGGWRQLMQRG